MGGPGSGRIAWRDGKIRTEDVCSISIAQLASKGLFSGEDNKRIDLVRYDEPYGSILVHSWQTCIALICDEKINDRFPVDIMQSIEIETTPCNFGGTRPWFTCPKCLRRVGVLFIVPLRTLWLLDAIVGCRNCHNLPYASQLESEFDQACRQIRKVQYRLGHPDWYNVMEPWFPRPKGMHRTTYLQILLNAKDSFEKVREGMAKVGMHISPMDNHMSW